MKQANVNSAGRRRVPAWLPGLVLLLCLGSAYGDTDVRVVVDTAETLHFLVSVSTHHADLHNGYSRVRFQELLQANESHHIDTGFYVTLVHYSAWAYHPDFLLGSTRNEGRFGALPPIEPEPWARLLDGLDSLPLTGTGPTYARAAEHIRMYPRYYLPALDRAQVPPAADALQHLEAFHDRAETLAGLSGQMTEGERNTALRLQDKASRALAELRLQLSLDRSQRVAVREFKALTAGPKPMIEALAREPGLDQVAAYLAAREVRAKQPPDKRSSPAEKPQWHGKYVDVMFSWSPGAHYRFRSDDYPDPLSCSGGHARFDGGHIAPGVELDLEASVEAAFCRHPDGVWRLHSRWAR